MSENEQENSIFINGRKACAVNISTGTGVAELVYGIETKRMEFTPPPDDDKQVAFNINTRITASFEMTMTTEQAESFFGAFTEPRLIAKISTKKGDLYAPVKSHTEGSITLDIPDNEAEMWRQSDYWKAELAEQERRLEAINRGESE